MCLPIPWISITLLVLSALNPACHCDCDPATELRLPPLDTRVAQSVRVHFRRESATHPQISCTWDDTDAAGTPSWSCTPAASSVRTDTGTPFQTRFTFQEADPSAEWSIELQGPSGSQVLTRVPRDSDPGEGYPGSCVCYDYIVTIEADDLRAVGATAP
jgi:hypothetical protein